MASVLLDQRTSVVELADYHDSISGVALTNEVVTADLLTDPIGGPQAAVSAETTGMSLTYDPETRATYRALIPNTTPITPGVRYLIRIRATSAYGEQIFEHTCFGREPN